MVRSEEIEVRIERAADILVRTGVCSSVADAVSLVHRLRGGDATVWPAASPAIASSVRNMLVCDAGTALRAMETAAAEAGCTVRSLGTGIDEPAHTLARRLVGELSSGDEERVVIVGAGETTVHVEPDLATGQGGRNQEVALAAAVLGTWPSSAAADSVAVGSVGTDGQDNGPAAGAVVAASLADDERAVDALRRHDSYTFFTTHAPHCHLITGPTHTNVADIFAAVRL